VPTQHIDGSTTLDSVPKNGAIDGALRWRRLLTARELEPYQIYERTQKEFGITSFGGSPEELAAVTDHIYFAAQRANGAQAASDAHSATGL
jgi:hypothetical protein